MHHGMRKGAPSCVKVPIPGRNGQWNKKRPKNYDRKPDGGRPERILGVYGSCQVITGISTSFKNTLSARGACFGGVPWMRLTCPEL